MNGWVIMIVLVLAVVGGLWYWFRKDIGALQFLGAVLMLALAGYYWQGRPSFAGQPKAQAAGQERPDSDFAQLRRDMFPQFDRSAGWLTAAEALTRSGKTESAVNLLRDQIEQSPRDMVLWLGAADALLQHSNGMLTPAAEMAFNRAAQVAPQHPAPRFFYALALMRLGQFEAADQFLDEILTLPELNDTWRDYVGRARQMSLRLRQAGPSGPPPMQ